MLLSMIAVAKVVVVVKRGVDSARPYKWLGSCDQVRSLCQKRRVGKNINQAWKARMRIWIKIQLMR